MTEQMSPTLSFRDPFSSPAYTEFQRRVEQMLIKLKIDQAGPRVRGGGPRFEVPGVLRAEAASDPVPEFSFPYRDTGNTIALAGYWHEKPYFEAHKDQVEAHVRGASVLVTEHLPTAGRDESARRMGRLESSFFWEVERVAHRAQVPVICDDPVHHRAINFRLGKNDLERAADAVSDTKLEVLAALFISTCTSLGLGIVSSRRATLATELKRQVSLRKVSRRSFLAGSLLTGFSGLIGGSLYATVENILLTQPYHRRTDDVGVLRFDAEDYRDVATAYTIATLARGLPKGSRIAVTYGFGHMRPLLFYLRNPFELAMRMALYKFALGDAIPPSEVYISDEQPGVHGDDEQFVWRVIPREEFISERKNSTAL